MLAKLQVQEQLESDVLPVLLGRLGYKSSALTIIPVLFRILGYKSSALTIIPVLVRILGYKSSAHYIAICYGTSNIVHKFNMKIRNKIIFRYN